MALNQLTAECQSDVVSHKNISSACRSVRVDHKEERCVAEEMIIFLNTEEHELRIKHGHNQC